MPGAHIGRIHGSNTTSQTSVNTGANTLNVATGDALLALVTYDGGNDDPDLNDDWGVWEEDLTLQRLNQSPRFHVYTIDSAVAANVAASAAFGSSRSGAAIVVIQQRNAGGLVYEGGVFPPYDAPGSGTGNITSGNLNVTNQPNYLVGFGWDLDSTGTEPPVTSGNGFTSRATCWIFGAGVGNDNANIVDRRVTANGNVAVTFDSGFGSHSYAALLFRFSETSGSVVNNITAEDVTIVVDAFIALIRRIRDASEVTIVSEGGLSISTIYAMLIEESIDVVDSFLRRILSNRTQGDSVISVDDFLSSIIGHSLVTAVATDVIQVSFGTLLQIYRNRQHSEATIITEGGLESTTLFNIVSASLLELIDASVVQLMYFVSVVDTASVIDDVSAVLTRFTAADGTKIRIGTDQPRIELGGYVS